MRKVASITANIKHEHYADGRYLIRAKGFLTAELRWAKNGRVLLDWTPIAYIPILPNGAGEFRYTGQRGIPPEADSVMASFHSFDEEEIYENFCLFHWNIDHQGMESASTAQNKKKFILIGDVHMTSKPGRLRYALDLALSLHPDALLFTGDLVNDGTPEQFSLFLPCIEKSILSRRIAPGEKHWIPVCCAAGNHDYPHCFLPHVQAGGCPDTIDNIVVFQDRLNGMSEEYGYQCEQGIDGSYAVKIRDVDISVLNAEMLSVPGGRQIQWLEKHLESRKDAEWHIILCHKPLLNHNPMRADGAPYLSGDSRLQELIDRHTNMIFISGHTHISPNSKKPCVEFDPERKNLYINDGSLCPAELRSDEALLPHSWKDGIITELEINDDYIEVTAISNRTRQKISRGYYKFRLSDQLF